MKKKLVIISIVIAFASGVFTILALPNEVSLQAQQFLNINQVNSPIENVYAVSPLTNVIADPSNNLMGLESFYTISFDPSGSLKFIDIAFPPGFDVSKAQILDVNGITLGSLSIVGQKVTYILPGTMLPTGRVIIELGGITNPLRTTNQVSVTTRDKSGIILDGPTKSAIFTLREVSNPMLGDGAVSSSKMSAKFMKFMTLKPNQNGWIPDGNQNGFIIMDSSVSSKSIISISVNDTTPGNRILCGVDKIDTGVDFGVECLGSVPTGSTLNYMITNP